MKTREPAPPGATAFGRYAAWYDAFNRPKDYSGEARYVLETAQRWVPSPRNWLDIGCGTGKHLAFLQTRGISVEGLDASPAMIEQARRNYPHIPFHVGAAESFHLAGNRDVISMLFHTMSYQITDRAIRQILANIAGHLAPRGLLVFDFWHTGGLLNDPPGVRTREVRLGNRTMFRIARPSEDRAARRVDVHFEFRWDSPDGPLALEEDHSMRHFTVEELRAFLEGAGLGILASEAWMQHRALQPADWYGLICARSRTQSTER